MLKFTKTEQKILDFLSDGRGHRPAEICEYLGEGEYEVAVPTLRVHVMNINKELRKIGEAVKAIANGKTTYYQHIRLIKMDD